MDDAEAILAIYAPYVQHTAISFDIEVPTIEEFRQRMATTLSRYPYFVAESDGRIVGYAYVGPFKERAAYDHCVETSIYIDPRFHGKGIGTALYAELERALSALGIKNLNACIAWTDCPDEHLDNHSTLFHSRRGFTKVAHFHRCGLKFGHYYDMIWMEKIL